MKQFLIFGCLLAAVTAVSFFDLVQEEWLSFKLEHNKTYEDPITDKHRMSVYADNKYKVVKHNQQFANKRVSFRLKMNHFGDMLHQEFVKTMNGFDMKLKNYNKKQKLNRGATYIPAEHVQLPDHVDWRKRGAVTEIKDQGKCGSCWSFSTTGALEAQHFRKSDVLVSLSEQNLIDCSKKFGNNGCNGGLMDNAFKYIKSNGGIDTERSYPYEAVDDKCRFNKTNVGADDVGFVDVPEGDEEKLKHAVATIGPVSVAIDASQQSFQFYSDGVYYDENCSSTQLDHGVLVVGYGTDEDGGDYWLVKNSWGRNWGDLGYIKMARNRDNHCGIASSASYPLV